MLQHFEEAKSQFVEVDDDSGAILSTIALSSFLSGDYVEAEKHFLPLAHLMRANNVSEETLKDTKYYVAICQIAQGRAPECELEL